MVGGIDNHPLLLLNTLKRLELINHRKQIKNKTAAVVGTIHAKLIF